MTLESKEGGAEGEKPTTSEPRDNEQNRNREGKEGGEYKFEKKRAHDTRDNNRDNRRDDRRDDRRGDDRKYERRQDRPRNERPREDQDAKEKRR